MNRRKKNLKPGLDNGECAFFNDMPMIVTSSPISDGKRVDNTSPVTFRHSTCEDNPTWSDLLGKFQSTSRRGTIRCENKQNLTSNDESLTTESELTSSSYEPVAEHKMKILVTPGRKIQVLSSSARKLSLRQPTPKKPVSYSKAQQLFRKKAEEQDDESDESMQTIKTRLRSAENLSAEDIERYERILRRLVHKQNAIKKETNISKNSLVEDSELMHFVESQIGQCDLSPRTVRILGKQSQEQEKKLISLAVLKRTSQTEIKKRINQQLLETKEQVRIHFKYSISLIIIAIYRLLD